MALLNGKNVIFGGIGDTAVGGTAGLADTYEWDGTAWTKREVVGPSARWSHEMATLNGKVVLFGGFNQEDWYLGETWEWDGATWTKREVAGPAGRVGHAMATVGNQIVMFGGQGDDGCCDDTWVWDGENWTEMKVSPSPSQRHGHAMAGGPQKAIMFGGAHGQEYAKETWEWDGQAWARHEVPGPPGRSGPGMAQWGSNVLLFGGVRLVGSNTYEYLSDTWIWEGEKWRELKAPGPQGVSSAFMASR
jgi:hypothetical protein